MRKGVLDKFGVDFIVVNKGINKLLKWDLFVIEINLCWGGIIYLFMILKLLINGSYDYEIGLFYS